MGLEKSDRDGVVGLDAVCWIAKVDRFEDTAYR